MNTVTQAHHALGLVHNPFPPTPDATFYFYTNNLYRDFAEALHCIQSRKGFLLLTGEVGLGKSTFVSNLMETLRAEGTAVALVLNTFLQGSALLEAINNDFGLPPTSRLSGNALSDNMVSQLVRLNTYLLKCGRQGKNCVLIIDDAQNLNAESLELIRLLCNLETRQEKLLQIVLVGQPELLDTLSSPSLRQLKSRIVKYMQLTGLTLGDTAKYIKFRLTEANPQAEGGIEVASDAVDAIHRVTAGNPRQLHLIMDRCLYGLVARRTRKVTIDLVQCAVAETTVPTLSHGDDPKKSIARKGLPLRGGLLAAAVALLMPTLAVAAWSMWQDAPRQILPATVEITPPPPAPPAIPNGDHAVKENNFIGDCANRLSPAAQPDIASQLIIQSLTPEAIASFGTALAARGVACLIVQPNSTFLVWHRTPQSEQARGAQPNSAVQTIQRSLQNAGLLTDADVDGWLGARTRDALRYFQTRYHLPASGKPDALTTLVLENFYDNRTRVTDHAS
jgi:general secretion pathway protein A